MGTPGDRRAGSAGLTVGDPALGNGLTESWTVKLESSEPGSSYDEQVWMRQMTWSRRLRLPGMGSDDAAELDEAIDWLRSRAHEVSAVGQSPDEFADLEWLRDAVGDARLVALGEATHGTHEFFAMKLRLLHFMVTELGFSAFAIEASWAEANLINQFVHTGQGDPHALLEGLGFWRWNTQEVLDLILWIRTHNKDAPPEQAVSFFGFDVQFPSVAVENVLEFLGGVDPPARTTAELRYARLQEYLVRPATLLGDRAMRLKLLRDASQRYERLPRRVQRQVRQGLQRVHEDLERNRERYVRASSNAGS